MIYRLLQWIGGIALHWYYRHIEIIGRDRIPVSGPIIVAVNHQNALVDALLAQWVVPRRQRITAKATLSDTIFGALLVKVVEIIPLRRSSDESAGASAPMRNRNAFRQIIEALSGGSAVLIFPEGKSHNDPSLAPLKTGLARVALWARNAGIRGMRIVPIGLTFEDKARPDTVVTAHVGEPITVDEWPTDDPQALTTEIAERLRATVYPATVSHQVPTPSPPFRQSWLVTLAAWWGQTIHKIPIEVARRLALAKSRDAGEPAMYTMIYGLALTLLASAIQVSIVWLLLGWWVACLYFILLLIGAYWAAYAPHVTLAQNSPMKPISGASV
jgi:1-acyl-sn-glycerol-3-phosphate acyltransferase